MDNLTESLEKYLLAIYELTKDGNHIIVKDISEYLKIGGASTAESVKSLRDKGFVNYVPYGNVSLSEKGNEVVLLKLYRHNVISQFLDKVLEIDKDIVDKNVKAIEYSMTEDVLNKFVQFLDFMNQCSCKEPKWMNGCKHNLKYGIMPDKCENCKLTGGGCTSCCCSK